MKCDELEKIDAASNADLSAGYDHRYAYDADEVDAAIAELKEEVNNLFIQNRELCQALQVMYSAEEYTKLQAENAELKQKLQDQCIHCPVKMQEDNVVADKDKKIAELKAKLENVQASMYADVVDANMENRRLKHSLYNLRACFADMMQKRYIECKTDGWVHRVNKWIEVERRSRNKAEEYK